MTHLLPLLRITLSIVGLAVTSSPLLAQEQLQCVDGRVLPGPRPLTANELDAFVANAEIGSDVDGLPVLFIQLTQSSAREFAELTRNTIGQIVELKLGDNVLIAPVVRAPISDGALQLSGNFTTKELQEIKFHLLPSCAD